MNPHIFREYDIRGIVGRDLDAGGARSIGRAFASHLAASGQELRVVVGHDCRVSSPELSQALVEGLMQAGAEVLELGMVPTPLLYFHALRQKADGAIQLTGSHNPPDYNGFKMMRAGHAVYGDEIQLLRRIIDEQAFATGTGSRRQHTDSLGEYIDWVTTNARMGARPLKIVVDGGNGVGGPTAVPLLRGLGVQVIDLYCDPDGRFPNHHPDPTVPENIEVMRQRVLSERADFGVAFDGDADRIGVVDEAGRILWGDKLMIILARDVLHQQPGAAVVGEVKCSQTLFDDVTAHGGRAIMWKVGHSLIKTKMKEVGAALAGEMSGHIFFAHRYFGFDDAIYTATRLAEIVSRSTRPLSSFLEGVPETFATPEIRIDTGDDAVKFEVARRVAASYEAERGRGVRDLVTLDGVRVIFADGWGLVRASNTQPVLVLRAEAATAERRDAIESDLRQRVEAGLASSGQR